MEITSNTTPLAATTAAPPTANDLLASDYETFLEMLSTQMQNQDPLNPVDSTDFATQLAQFSALEQQVRTNDILANLSNQMAVSGISQLASWVGMEARTIAPANFDGDAITLVPSPASLSDETFLIVRDEAGTIVQRKKIPVSSEPINWDGNNDNGNSFPDGVYSFDLESRAEGEILDITPVENYATVVEAQILDGSTILVLEGGSHIDSSEISALRRAG